MNGWHEELDRRCTARNRAGERCSRAPIRGGSVCSLHGGRSPNAQAEARATLAAMAEPVLGVFRQILETWYSTRCTGCGHVDEHGNVCRGCGKPTGDPAPVIRVGQLVLDRAGFSPSMTLRIEQPNEEFENLSLEELADRAEEFARIARARADEEQRRLLPAAVDAELIDEGVDVDDPPPEPAAVDPIPSWISTPEERTDENGRES